LAEPTGSAIIKRSILADFEVKVIRVPTFIGFVLVEKGFIKIGFSIVIIIVELDDSSSSDGSKNAIHDFHAERFIETGGKSLPGYFIQFIINSAHDPYISGKSPHGETTVREKGEGRGAHP
jgi:hypothetical protein